MPILAERRVGEPTIVRAARSEAMLFRMAGRKISEILEKRKIPRKSSQVSSTLGFGEPGFDYDVSLKGPKQESTSKPIVIYDPDPLYVEA